MSSKANEHDSAKQNRDIMSSNTKHDYSNVDSAKHYSDGQWVIEIYGQLEELSVTELDLENCHEVCVCQVPDSLSGNKREAFIPQLVGLGPYHHHFLADERDHKLIMTRENKLAAAKRVLKDILPDKSSLFKERFRDFGSNFQTFFYPDENSTNLHTLSSILTVDGLFLLSFIRQLGTPASKAAADAGFSYFLTGNLRMFTTSGVESKKNALIREVFKLENQIPFHVLKKISEVNGNEIQSPESDVMNLRSLVGNVCKQNCPLVKLENPLTDMALEEYHHLLDFTYHLIVPKPKPDESKSSKPNLPQAQAQAPPPAQAQDEAPPQAQAQAQAQADAPPQAEAKSQAQAQDNAPNGKRKTCCGLCCTVFLYAVVAVILIVIVLWLIVKQILGLVLWVLKRLFGLFQWIFRPCLLEVLSELDGGKHILPSTLIEGAEALVGIMGILRSADFKRAEKIPSVTKLHKVGIMFQPAKKGISSIKFDDCVFSLPCIRVDDNSEVIIRNLMAYETLFKSNNSSLVFTRYVELMKAILDLPEDVRILVDNQIIESELPDEVITDLFKGMAESTRPAKSPELEKVIHKVNAKFDSIQKRNEVVKKCTSVKFIASIGGLVFLAFTAFQTYCNIYNCSRTSKLAILSQDAQSYTRDHYFLSSI